MGKSKERKGGEIGCKESESGELGRHKVDKVGTETMKGKGEVEEM